MINKASLSRRCCSDQIEADDDIPSNSSTWWLWVLVVSVGTPPLSLHIKNLMGMFELFNRRRRSVYVSHRLQFTLPSSLLFCALLVNNRWNASLLLQSHSEKRSGCHDSVVVAGGSTQQRLDASNASRLGPRGYVSLVSNTVNLLKLF